MKKILILLFMFGIFACGEQNKPEQTEEPAMQEEAATMAADTMMVDSTAQMEEDAPE